jgi:menaquinone-9 beta-reductase
MTDVLIVGAGPAGSVAATVLARAGAKVRLIDRAAFPRDKLCGDTVNPGTLAILRRLGLSARIEDGGLPVEGMRLTGGSGVAVDGRYPDGRIGRALARREFDWALLTCAVQAGAAFEPQTSVRRAIVDEEGGRRRVDGVVSIAQGGAERAIRARVTIAADGRRSTIAFGLGLARHPARPRRWAIGAYFADVAGLGTLGEMHVRQGRYIGIAPVPGGVVNVCLVRPSRPGDASLADPSALLTRELMADPQLRDRFAGARLAQAPVVLGPLAVDASREEVEGLLLAGDAAGFVDPMTGDGLRFAVRGGELAAMAALEALQHGWPGVHARLAARRRREFGAKQRFNRALRALVGSPRAVTAATLGARVVPAVFQAIIRRAGDCDLVAAGS